MKKPLFELYVTSELSDHDAWLTGSKYRRRWWEGCEEELTRLMHKWCAKSNTVSATMYDNHGYMVASYQK